MFHYSNTNIHASRERLETIITLHSPLVTLNSLDCCEQVYINTNYSKTLVKSLTINNKMLSLNDLPVDILVVIFYKLDFAHLCICEQGKIKDC